MHDPAPGVFELVSKGCAAALAGAMAMPLVFAAMFVLPTLAAFLAAALPFSGAAKLAVMTLVTLIVTGVAFAGFAVALHRFVILGEVNGVRSLAARWREIAEFSLLTFAIQLSFGVIFLTAGSASAWLLIPVTLGALYVTIRIVLIFPAIAVDAPKRTLTEAFRAGSGLFWRVIGTSLVVAIPIGLAQWILLELLGGKRGAPIVLRLVVENLSTITLGAIGVAVASQLFIWRTRGPYFGSDAAAPPTEGRTYP